MQGFVRAVASRGRWRARSTLYSRAAMRRETAHDASPMAAGTQARTATELA